MQRWRGLRTALAIALLPHGTEELKESDEEYVGLCAEFPSLSWLASTPEAALRGIRKVVSGVLADMKEAREPVPEPFASRKFSGRFMIRVPPKSTATWRSRVRKQESA
jgi:predicted RNase H-like HicB family nuclease